MSEKNVYSPICLLKDYPSVEKALLELGFTHGSIKRWHFSKKFLNKKVFRQMEVTLPLGFLNDKMIGPIYEGPEIKILFEDENLLAFDKPPFIHGHPLNYEQKNNCLSFLRQNRSDYNLWTVNEEHIDRGLLYRLDYPTSGVMIYIKKEEFIHQLRKKFHELVIEKKYLAIVRGHFNQLGIKECLLRPSGRKNHKMVPRVKDDHLHPDEKLATLYIENSTYNKEKDVSLLEIKLVTGLRHQIRAQLSLLNHPIVGDDLYGDPLEKNEKRLFLHALEYKVNFPFKTYDFMAQHPLFFDIFFL